MGVKEFLERMREKKRQRQEMMRQADDQIRVQHTLEERQKSANERELERFHHEDREEMIKQALAVKRTEREEDIRLNHNALDVPNITNHTEFEVLKEPNQFAGKGNMFVNQQSILHNDPGLMNNGDVLKNNKDLFKNNMQLVSGRYKL